MRAAVEVINERSYAQATMTDIAASLDLQYAPSITIFRANRCEGALLRVRPKAMTVAVILADCFRS